MLDFKPFQTVKISTVISYKYLKSLFFILISLFHRNKHMKQLMAGGGVALIGMTLVPLLSGLFS